MILHTFLFISLLSFKTNGQSHTSSNSKDIIEVETILKKSQQKYDAAKKKVYRAEEKLIHLKKIGVLSYSELTLLLEHNTTLISQTKSNPSFRKSIRSTASNSNAKSQRKTIQDIHQEKIEQIRQQQKQALVNKVKENRNKIKQQKKDAATKKKLQNQK